MTVRSNFQLQATILNHLRQALAMGYDDDAQIAYAASMVGQEYLPLVGRVHAREFKTYDPI